METFLLKLAVAVIPLVALVVSVVSLSSISSRYAHHPLTWHRRNRTILRALAAGVMMR